MRFFHPIHSFPFDTPVANALAEEHGEQPFGRRSSDVRKAVFRELGLAATGQRRLRTSRVPRGVRRLLWIYTWTTVGDAIMDLSARTLIPGGVEVDLLIAAHLAPLFASDTRLHAVHVDVSTCADDYDFVLLDSLRTSSMRLKAKRFAAVPFASMREHQRGERFDRAAYADRRMRQLFGLPLGEVAAPRLDLAPWPRRQAPGATCVAVALGARVEQKRYRRWPDVLQGIVAGWPAGIAPPQFWLMGQGDAAMADLAGFDPGFVAAHARVCIDGGSLADAARDIAECDAFLGVDGGLMHVAIGVGTPGLALFTRIDPRYFLRPGSSMLAMTTLGGVADVAAADITAEFLKVLPAWSARRETAASGGEAMAPQSPAPAASNARRATR